MRRTALDNTFLKNQNGKNDIRLRFFRFFAVLLTRNKISCIIVALATVAYATFLSTSIFKSLRVIK